MTLIQQKSPNDCVLAAIAMACGAARWEDVWNEADLQQARDKKGLHPEDWLHRVGLVESKHWKSVYVNSDRWASAMLWRRHALIMWDGHRIWDPHEGHQDQGFQHFKHITTLSISRAIIFDESIFLDHPGWPEWTKPQEPSAEEPT